MDLNAIRQAVQTVDREVEFRPAGKPTGWFFTLRHESAPEVQEVLRTFRAKVRNLAFKQNMAAYQAVLAQHEDELRIAHVVSWRWDQPEDEKHPAFSKKELQAILDDEKLGYHVGKFIDEEVGTLNDFLKP